MATLFRFACHEVLPRSTWSSHRCIRSMSLPPTQPLDPSIAVREYSPSVRHVEAKAFGALVEDAFVVCHQHDPVRADVGLRLMKSR
jgi:hypothetical protein